MKNKCIFGAIIIGFMFIGTIAHAEIKVDAYPNPVPQGKCTAIQVINDEGYVKNVEAELTLPSGKKITIPFYAWGFKWRGIVPIGLEYETGIYTLNLSITGNDDQVIERTENISVISGAFKTVHFNLPAQKAAILYSGEMTKEWPSIEAILQIETPDQLYTNKFKLPIKGWLTMPLGTREFANGKKKGQHTGNDFGANAGLRTLIRASNSGTVVMARPFDYFGNTVVIDHGQGIYSIYYHLSRIAVKEGQSVNQGGILGNMGSTGVSTSPHLHYGFSVHDVIVDGLQWIKDPTFKKYVQ